MKNPFVFLPKYFVTTFSLRPDTDSFVLAVLLGATGAGSEALGEPTGATVR